MRAVAKKPFLKSLGGNTRVTRILRCVSASERCDSTVNIVAKYLQIIVCAISCGYATG